MVDFSVERRVTNTWYRECWAADERWAAAAPTDTASERLLLLWKFTTRKRDLDGNQLFVVLSGGLSDVL